jgi:YegS/Rv2252/BmrU family lipid kinase
MKYYVIVNPLSGRGKGEKSIPQIEQWLKANNIDYTFVRTERPWHAADLAQKAATAGYNVVVAASGDGTINETLNGLMRARQQGFTSTAMATLSIGTGNDFAASVGLPLTLDEGLKLLKENHRRKIDIGRVTIKQGTDLIERYFGNGIGIGFDAMVGFEAVKVRWAVGVIPYLIGVMKTIMLYYNAPHVRMTIDGETHEQPSLMTSIMNGRRMGGGFIMAPEGKADDGWLDLCIASEAPRLRLFQLIPYFLKGTQKGQPEIQMKLAKKITVTALTAKKLPAHADGEMLCVDGDEITAEILPSALEIVG